MSIAEKIVKLQDIKRDIKEAIESTDLIPGDNMEQYGTLISSRMQRSGFTNTEHIDANGKWCKPEDWPDIESINIPEGNSEVYYLFSTSITEQPFCSIRVYGTGLQYAFGEVIKEGETTRFEPFTSYATISNGGYLRKELTEYKAEYPYIVLHIKGTTITQLTFGAAVAPLPTYSAGFSPCLMRYGRLPKATSILCTNIYFIESDNIMDFAKDLSGSTLTLASMYSGSFSLKRLRTDGWNIKNNKTASLASMFAGCLSLVDVPAYWDLSGWCSATTTTIGSMFNNCYTLPSILDVSDWDVANVTTMASMFANARSLKKIIGLQTWTHANKCTTLNALFSNCANLFQHIDLTSMVPQSTALINVQNMISGSGILSINVSGINLTSITTALTSMFASGSRCKEIILQDVIWPTNCTNFNALFNGDFLLETVRLSNIDFSKSNAAASMASIFYNCYSIKNLTFENCIPPAIGSIAEGGSSNGYIFYGCRSLTDLDLSWLDMRAFTGAGAHAYMLRTCTKLKNLIPPVHISKSFYISDSQYLTHDSLLRILENLDDMTDVSGTFTLTIGAVNKAKLTVEEQAIATSKRWTIA